VGGAGGGAVGAKLLFELYLKEKRKRDAHERAQQRKIRAAAK
jgi:hypothetical protein